jgi:segregation and condensation protein A
MDGGSAPAAPVVHLEHFEGPLDLLLELARAQKVDLGRIAVADLVDPFVAAIAAQAKTTPLAQLGDWLVTASWLTWLKSRLLLPATAPAAIQAQDDAARLRERLESAAHIRALADWLESRPQLGWDVFARGRPEVSLPAPTASGDLLDLLLACFAVYDLPTAPAKPVQRLAVRDHFPMQEALARLRQILAAHPEGGALKLFLPPRKDGEVLAPSRARGALASTFLAGLELARQEVARMTQAETFGDIHLGALQTKADNPPAPDALSAL